MGRHVKFTDGEAAMTWTRLFRAKKKPPTVAEFSEALGVSGRTGWRYMRRICTAHVCPTCGGRGFIERKIKCSPRRRPRHE